VRRRCASVVALIPRKRRPYEKPVEGRRLAISDEALVEDADETVEFQIPVPSTMPAPSAPVVVVVDDEAAIRTTLVRALGDLYTVYEAADGREAQELLRLIAAPQAIVCDVSLPGMDGIELATSLRKDPRTWQVPILFLSGRRAASDVVKGINAGARHYVTKPFDVADVVSKVGMMTSKRS
jgi:CheY-like chemotaxis protein